MRWLLPFVALCLTGAASAQGLPWPKWVRSVEAGDDGIVVRSAASENSPRRGVVREATRMKPLARTIGFGCGDSRFVKLGDEAYVCERDLILRAEPPAGEPQPPLPPGSLLPNEYAFVVSDGTPAYARLADYLTDEYEQVLGRHFGLVVTERVVFEGIGFVRAASQLYVPEESLRPASASRFAGVVIDPGQALNVAWVSRKRTNVYDAPGGRVLRRIERRRLLRIRGESRGGTLELVDGGFVKAQHVARARPTSPPAELLPEERWIDVDVETQILTAYEGAHPVYATLVSTGTEGESTRTPRGTFRIWVKLATADMDDIEREDVSHNYSIEKVPWVQYFQDGYGFHAAFWHDDFGERRSRGCVNLSPRDARWLFDWTGPHLPDGWKAVLATDRDRGTLVVVR